MSEEERQQQEQEPEQGRVVRWWEVQPAAVRWLGEEERHGEGNQEEDNGD